MKKVVKNGQVAVLISDGWGSGFHTWGAPVEAIFDPTLINFIVMAQLQEAITYVESTYPDVYTGGIDELIVRWIPEGAKFIITEYDGNESIMLQDQEAWITA